MTRLLRYQLDYNVPCSGSFTRTWRPCEGLHTGPRNHHHSFIIIRQPLCPVVGPRPQHAVCPAQVHFIFLTLYIIYIYITVVLSLTQMLVLLSLYVCDVEHTSFHFGLWTSSLFCACLVSVQVSAPYAIAVSTQELHTVSSGRWQGCFWRYPGVWRMPPSLPWFFVVSLCPGSFTWGVCTVVPSTRSLGHFLSAHFSRL